MPGATPRPVTRAAVVGAAVWTILPLYWLVEVVVASRVTAPFSFLTHTISDLGASTCTWIPYRWDWVEVCSPWHPLMNGAFAAFGILLATGAWLVSTVLPPTRLRALTRALFVCAGVSAIGTALVPIDTVIDLHSLVSVPIFFFAPAATTLLAFQLARESGALRTVGGLGVGIGVFCLIAAIVTVTLVSIDQNWSIPERLTLWPLPLWASMLGATLLLTRRGPGARPAQHSPGTPSEVGATSRV
ncbi:DUF998 domain-containing protein [Georgenia sp. Z1491]|uniref:DUF998 domain-containing protein n=1 Tax=Georgenia sp. Z1491 TaxID=3416707 RepID=UPI003CEE7C4A